MTQYGVFFPSLIVYVTATYSHQPFVRQGTMIDPTARARRANGVISLNQVVHAAGKDYLTFIFYRGVSNAAAERSPEA